MITRKFRIFLIIFTSLIALSGCQNQWQIAVLTNGKGVNTLSKNEVSFYIENSVEEIEVIPLGQMLFASGFTLVDEITLRCKDDEVRAFIWDEIAEESTISTRGEVMINAESCYPTEINISPSTLAPEIEFSIMDISPTVADALDLPQLPDAIGKSLITDNYIWEHAVMVLMDGVQFDQLREMIDDEALTFLGSHGELTQGLTVYPPITTSSSASLLTGAPPIETGIFGYGYRSTALTTLFDLAVVNGKTVTAIEGTSLPFNLRNAETSLSGDQDGNGYSDDNVFLNSMEVIQDQMPDLLYIHFHEIDDMGHAYGPESAEYASALIRVDGYLSQIFEALPANTFIAIFSDHGMHTTTDGGNHGALMANDLIIPILLLTK